MLSNQKTSSVVSNHFPRRRVYDDDVHDHDVDTPSVDSAFFCLSTQSMEASYGKVRVSCGISARFLWASVRFLWEGARFLPKSARFLW